MSKTPQAGDWVSFYRAGKIVLGEVRYVRPCNSYSGDMELCTTEGAVAADGVLEVRSGTPTDG